MNTVTVDLSRKDLLRAQFQMVRRMWILKLLFVLLLAYNVYLVFNSSPRPPLAVRLVVALVVAGLFTLTALLVTYLFVAIRILSKLRHQRGVLGRHEFTIDDDGLRENTEVNETRVAFGHAQQVFRTRKYMFVRIRALGFFLIPRRSFADPSADAQFWNALQPLAAQKEK
jgi:hypothetical protein